MPKPTIPASLQGAIQSRPWPSNKAILLVHGVGNAGPGDYQDLVQAVQGSLGAAASDFAIYQLFYDEINDWAQDKSPFEDKLKQFLEFAKNKVDPADLADGALEVVGDVLWPVMSQSIRLAIRKLYLAQLQQMVLDGLAAGVYQTYQELHIIAHSLGCFHTFEALHAAATHGVHRLRPDTDGVRFRNVILMASPVQLIRSVGRSLGPLVSKNWNTTLADAPLSLPAEVTSDGRFESVRNFVSITGELDPVGGYFSRTRADWAYMSIPGQESYIDDQDWFETGGMSLSEVLTQAIRNGAAPDISPNNPHSWLKYVQNYGSELNGWLTT